MSAVLHERLRTGRDRLVAAGIAPEEAAIDVDLFARTILGWDLARLIGARREPTPAGLEPRFSEWIARRATREPSAYIVGAREFWGLTFRVASSVLIPRPETELVVEESLRLLAATGVTAPRLADIGTGSGCIAVSLAHELPACTVVATDVSAAALAVARSNAERHGVEGRIRLVETKGLHGVDGPFDLVAANPPYVKDGDRDALETDVRHEPEVALFGGPAGLAGLEAALDAAGRTLKPGGWLVMEFGFGQEEDLRRLVEDRDGLHLRAVRRDLRQIPRTALIERTGAGATGAVGRHGRHHD